MSFALSQEIYDPWKLAYTPEGDESGLDCDFDSGDRVRLMDNRIGTIRELELNGKDDVFATIDIDDDGDCEYVNVLNLRYA